jgi:hypothetical protein
MREAETTTSRQREESMLQLSRLIEVYADLPEKEFDCHALNLLTTTDTLDSQFVEALDRMAHP